MDDMRDEKEILRELDKKLDNCVVHRWQFREEVTGSGILRTYIKPDGRQSNQRYPRKEYKHLKLSDLKRMIVRLNYKVDQLAKAKFEVECSFITKESLREFYDYLSIHHSDEKTTSTLYHCVYHYGILYFLKYHGPNYEDWVRNQHYWAQALLGKNRKIFKDGELRSAKTIKHTISTMNRLLKYLHINDPSVTNLGFEPITRAMYKDHEARRKRAKRESGEKLREGKYISKKDWTRMINRAPDSISPAMNLAYYYGLRRGEVLALNEECLFEDVLEITRQVDRVDSRNETRTYKNLKGREDSRDIDHVFTKAGQAYSWIANLKLMHPDTLGTAFSELMESLDMLSTFHDLRHTALTNWAEAAVEPFKLQKMAGHKDIKTTQKYIHAPERPKRKKYVPPPKIVRG